MPNENNGKVVYKKVKAYPLDGEMSKGTSKVVIGVMRLMPKGFIAHVRSGIPHVGMIYSCVLTLPISGTVINADAKVFKTFDGIDPKTEKAQRMVEVLFIKLPDAENLKIRSFLSAIGQKE